MKGARGSILGLWLVPLVPLLGEEGKSTAFAQQEEVPAVGLGAVHPICNTTSSTSSDCVASDEEVQEEILAELEADDEVTDARQDVELGEVLCDSLDEAEDAALLSFEISSNETVIAQLTSFTVVEAGVFTDGNERKIWKGDVIDPPPAEDTLAKTISMTWATPCSVETFLLKMIDTNPDGTTSVTTSVPCDAGSSNEICMVQFDIDLPAPSEPITPGEADELNGTSGVTRHLLGGRSTSRTPSRSHRRRSLDVKEEMDIPDRLLQGTTEIDVMVLYSSQSLDRVIGGANEELMESLIADELPKATEATTNSEIDLQFNLVHTGLLPYDQAATGSSAAESELITFTFDDDVKALRDTYAADLVVLVGSFSGTCGLGWVNMETAVEDEQFGFSLIDARCFEGRTTTHEMGHNLGCLHDIANNGIDPVNDYSHGMRYCTGAGTRFHTIMAYYCVFNPPDGYLFDYVPAINYWSNPDVSYMGVPTGTATANNAQTIRDNMEAVSLFRTPMGCGDTNVEGILGTNSIGSVCCPTGCGQCGGAGCGSVGAGEGLDNTDCCINGVLNNQDLCSASAQAPCVIEGPEVDTCDSLGIVALKASNSNGAVCCPVACPQCGRSGCGSSAKAAGLDKTDCCINGILRSQDLCTNTLDAPCVL